MDKFDGPLAPVPRWLVPSAEIPPGNPVIMKPAEFIPWCVDQFVAAGSPLLRAFELTGCTITETGRGAAMRGFNVMGVKATPAWAMAYQRHTGKPAPFFRAHGNRGTGDSQTVIYRAYSSPKEFFSEWLATFVPKNTEPKSRYYKTGQLFWNDGDWFSEMVAAGYRGDVTGSIVAAYLKALEKGEAPRTPKTILDQALLTEEARIWWAQCKLGGITVDGKWGTKSKTMCAGFQSFHGIAVTSMPNDETVTALARLVDASPAPMP